MFVGTTVAPGIAFGPALVWQPTEEPVPRQQVPATGVPAELARLEHAVEAVRRELDEVALRVATSVGEPAAAIFRAHRLMLEDGSFLERARRRIGERMAAASAVFVTVEEVAGRIGAASDAYLAARAADVRDLGRRLLAALRKDGPPRGPRLDRDCVLVAESLAPADVLALDRRHLLGLVIVQGGSTSHAAILAAGLGVPVVVSAPALRDQVRSGETVVVDGNHGHVLVRPTDLALREYRVRRALFEQFSGELAGLREAPAVTPDGRHVRLTANLGFPAEVPYALSQGAEGVGLMRTELLYLTHPEEPDEEEQLAHYVAVVEAMAPRPVTFRTFDLGGDKLKAGARPETNPMLGCRGLRVANERPELFASQVRALLRTSRIAPIDVMFPLVTSLTEFQDTLCEVRRIEAALPARQRPAPGRVRFGCMVETPAAAMIPDILASEAEFFSIGSNDLIQYTLAADRSDPRVANVYEPLHLAVLRMMRAILRAGHRHGRPVRLCGEMAADPIYTIILLGLGVDEMSMNPVMIPAIKQVIRSVRWDEARDVARGVLRERRAKDVQSYLETMMATRFPDVMSMYGHRDERAATEGELELPATGT